MAEFMTFIRGILIVGAQMMCKGIKPVFVNMFDEDSKAILEPKMANLPLVKTEWADVFIWFRWSWVKTSSKGGGISRYALHLLALRTR